MRIEGGVKESADGRVGSKVISCKCLSVLFSTSGLAFRESIILPVSHSATPVCSSSPILIVIPSSSGSLSVGHENVCGIYYIRPLDLQS